MRELSETTAALLKSRMMVGAQKPSLEIKLEGADYYSDILETKMTSVHTAADWGDFAIRSDGKVLFGYRVGLGLYLKVIDSEEIMMADAGAGEGGELFYSFASVKVTQCFSLLRLQNGKILLFVNDSGSFENSKPYKFTVFESASGLGSDFAEKTVLNMGAIINNNQSYMKAFVTKPVQDESGDIWLFAGSQLNYREGYNNLRRTINKSSDNGQTWSLIWQGDEALFDLSYFGKAFSICKIGDSIFCGNDVGYSYQAQVLISTDAGQTWTNYSMSGLPADSRGFREMIEYHYAKDGTLFMALHSYGKRVYSAKPSGTVDITFLNDFSNFTLVAEDNSSSSPEGILTISPKGNIHLLNLSGGAVRDFAMIREEYSAPIKPSSLTISKGRGGANTMNLTIDNSEGAMNPRNPEGSLYNILGLNKQIKVKQGYGADLIETFTGHIDSFTMNSFPHVMQISCRDALKKALDQTITEAGSHTVYFDAQPIENIFGYLCYLAGIETGEVQATGISISKEFSWQTYADAFQFLADLASFEFGADEYGKVYFRRDFQPDSIAIAYTFEEGVDITSLKYEMSDNDLYRTVKVYGKSGDTVLAYSAPFLDAAKYNILPQKVLKVDATEATTMAELQKIADRSIYLMNSRTAVVDFSAVAVPWLQVGDFIQVVERSSMSAGIYRISSLNLQMTDKEFAMDLQCYYYGDSIDIGTLPEDTATQAADPALNLIPEMTSNTEPSGVCRASSVATLQYNNYEPWNAFNSSSEDWFWNALTTYGWIEYQFTEKTIVDRYMLKARQALSYNDGMPKNWTFEAFDGEKWLVLDTQTNQTAWQIHEERFYNFANTTAYSRYRLNVTANNGENRLQLEQLAMYYRGGV